MDLIDSHLHWRCQNNLSASIILAFKDTAPWWWVAVGCIFNEILATNAEIFCDTIYKQLSHLLVCWVEWGRGRTLEGAEKYFDSTWQWFLLTLDHGPKLEDTVNSSVPWHVDLLCHLPEMDFELLISWDRCQLLWRVVSWCPSAGRSPCQLQQLKEVKVGFVYLEIF